MKAVLDPYGNREGRKPILNVCVTRSVENIGRLGAFSFSHPFLVKMCEVIFYGDPQLQTYNGGWMDSRR